jgi:two-component system cell cycle sensor histidine kinase/response regulator CckA
MNASSAIPERIATTVLVVEDEEAVCSLVQLVLRNHGFEVLLAQSGQEAVEASWKHAGPIHLRLTDWYLPDVGGQELARKLEASRPDMKVLFMSGSDKTLSGQDPKSFLRKPFTTTGLVQKIDAVLQQV